MKYQRIPPETAAEYLACKSREEWLLARSKSLGTSDFGALLGISTFRKPLQVYAEKRIDPSTGKPLIPSGDPTEAMEWGLTLEDVIRRHYAEDTGRKIWHREHTLFRHAELPFHASLDGIVTKPKGDRRILEVKTAWAAKDWGDEGTDDIPLSYVAGVQWSMGIFPEFNLADVAVLFGGNKYRVYTVERDDAIIKQMQEEAVAFWKRVVDGSPPEVTDGSTATRKALEALYQPQEEGKMLEADLGIKAAIEGLETAKEIFKEAEAEKKRYENIICAAIGPELGVTDGKRTCTWKSQERKGFTVEPSTCRVFRLSKNK